MLRVTSYEFLLFPSKKRHPKPPSQINPLQIKSPPPSTPIMQYQGITRDPPETHQRPTLSQRPNQRHLNTKSHPNPHPKNNRLPYQKNYVILHLNLSSNRFSKTIGKNNNHSNSNSSTRKYKKHNFNHLPTINTTTHKA